MIDPSLKKVFQQKILTWYSANHRDLPWRETRDPYNIFVSEVMLQQTQVERVIPKYTQWLNVFPTVRSLAYASVPNVLRYWSGLGYNSRALNMQKAALEIYTKYNGIFPQVPKDLQKLPGIGPYTGSAIACFAYDSQIPVIDTNIRKVIAFEFFDGVLPDEKTIQDVAFEILPAGRAYEWNQALMDYSRLVLKDKKIPVPKQSHFLSSDRYYRGQVIKMLLQQEQLTFSDLLDNFHHINPIESDRLEKIVKRMEKDGFIKIKGSLISL